LQNLAKAKFYTLKIRSIKGELLRIISHLNLLTLKMKKSEQNIFINRISKTILIIQLIYQNNQAWQSYKIRINHTFP
jgi:hypothetical protein